MIDSFPPIRKTLPTGTVTFLFTDIVGSTPLWESQPEQMAQALKLHHAILRRGIEAHSGVVFKVVGDEFNAAFSDALQALKAAVECQLALSRAAWQELGPLKVRMGLHTGAVELDPHANDYVSSHTLNRVSRIMSVAYGDQILLSKECADLVKGSLPQDVVLKDLGEHRLKGMDRLEHLFQVSAPGLSHDFPPLASMVYPNNLPAQISTFIGREREVDEIVSLLSDYRLVTLTGPGGIGKTRLAQRVANLVLEGYPNGVWLVELAALTDPALIPSTAAAALGLSEVPGKSITDTLVDFLRSRRLLLILDNCEHLLEGCARLSDELLRSCPDLTILASSREILGIHGEAPYRVPPMDLPDLRRESDLDALHSSDAVRLFIERAQVVRPDFQLAVHNARAVTQVCLRLDGIPLAIELAAARVRLLDVEQIAQRLEDRFRLLTGGSRTAMPRHQTLKAMMDWSWDLLDDPERVVLQRLSVFSGGWTLDAAEQVCADNGLPQGGEQVLAQGLIQPADILDILGNLVNKSLVLVGSEPGMQRRYGLLETIRQYARDHLLEARQIEIQSVRDRHQAYFADLSQQARPELEGLQQSLWMDRLEQENENLRTALGWSAEGGDSLVGLRMCSDLSRFWWVRGLLTEGLQWIELLTTRVGDRAPTDLQARVKRSAGILAWAQNNLEMAESFFQQCLSLTLASGDRVGIASAYNNLGLVSLNVNRLPQAVEYLEKCVALHKELDDQHGVATALNNLGLAHMIQGNIDDARRYYEESLTLHRQHGDLQAVANDLNNLGTLALHQKEYDRAAAYHQESLSIRRDLGNKAGIATSLAILAQVAQARAEYQGAQAMYEESLALYRELDHSFNVPWIMRLLAGLALDQGNLTRAEELLHQALSLNKHAGNHNETVFCLVFLARLALEQDAQASAARLLGAVDVELSRQGVELSYFERRDCAEQISALRQRLDPKTTAEAWEAGQAMSLDQAAALVLEL